MTSLSPARPLRASSSGGSLHRRSASSSSATASTSRRPLESAKTVLSAELFKRRHVTEFAHLHADADQLSLAAEEEKLIEERRIGRVKRQSIQKAQGFAQSNKENSWRPLSLLQHRQAAGLRGHTRSKTSLNGLSIDVQRHNPTLVRPLSSVRKIHPRPASLIGPSGQTLEILLENDDLPSLGLGLARTVETSVDSPASSSLNKSTYSWASSFSGETAELRTAAHYVPTETDLTSDGTVTESELLMSPANVEQRRKRIMAIAHTVRQLEGVGSRDMEDPTFYNVLAKAWYARFDTPKEQQQQSREDQDVEARNSFAVELAALGLSSPLPPDMEMLDGMQSPSDPEFRTPHLAQEGISVGASANKAYPRPSSQSTSQRSRSIRYSYASTLHDLALDGGVAQGDRLMSGKAWLRPSSYIGTPWGADFQDTPPPLRTITPENELDSSSSNDHQYLDSPFSLEPRRNLRRIETSVARPAAEPPIRPIAEPWTAGLGFSDAWWDGPSYASGSSATRPTDTASIHSSGSSSIPSIPEDFQSGEDDTIPSRPPAPTSTPTRPSSTLVVLDPRKDHTSSPSPGAINPNEPVYDTSPLPSPLLQVHFPPPPPTHPSDLFPPALLPPLYPLVGDQALSDANDYLHSIHSRPNFTKTPSNTSYPLPDDQSPSQREEEDGSIGLAISSPPLMAAMTTVQPMETHYQMTALPREHAQPISSLPSRPMHHPQPSTRTTSTFSIDPSPRIDRLTRRYSIDMIPRYARDDSESMMSLPSITLLSRPMKAKGPLPISVSYCSRASWRDTASRPMDREASVADQHRRDVVLPMVPTRKASLRHLGATMPTPTTVEIAALPSRQALVPVSNLQVAHRSRAGTLAEPRTMFILGFILPFTWFIGGWITSERGTRRSRRNDDVEKGPTAGVASTMPIAVPGQSETRWTRWTRWANHQDVWVRRCRLATAFALPVLILWGVIALIVIGVLA